MIVVDTNVLLYLSLPTEFTAAAERLLAQDSHWVAPLLWRSEFRNGLCLYIRKELLSLEDAIALQREAESLMAGNEFPVHSDDVLRLAQQSGAAAYDCEFVALAQSLNVPLVTGDKKLVRLFAGIATPLV